jgi:hypothetical protein
MTTFEPVALPPEFYLYETYMKNFGVNEETAINMMLQQTSEKLFMNDVYQVTVSNVHTSPNWPDTIHLSIMRIDKEPIHDWWDLQDIKNQLVGDEHDAIEVYPAESKIVDMANQYHLWVFADPSVRIPIGWQQRMVRGEKAAEDFGTKQRLKY